MYKKIRAYPRGVCNVNSCVHHFVWRKSLLKLQSRLRKDTPFDVPNKKKDVIKNCVSSIANLDPEFIRLHNLCEEHRFSEYDKENYEKYSFIYLGTLWEVLKR